MSARDELQDMRQLLGERGFVDACWAMRENASTPPPKPFQRDWRWTRKKVVDLKAYRKKLDADLEAVGAGGMK